MVKAVEKEHEETGKPVLGRQAILAQDPHDRPEHFERTPARDSMPVTARCVGRWKKPGS